LQGSPGKESIEENIDEDRRSIASNGSATRIRMLQATLEVQTAQAAVAVCVAAAAETKLQLVIAMSSSASNCSKHSNSLERDLSAILDQPPSPIKLRESSVQGFETPRSNVYDNAADLTPQPKFDIHEDNRSTAAGSSNHFSGAQVPAFPSLPPLPIHDAGQFLHEVKEEIKVSIPLHKVQEEISVDVTPTKAQEPTSYGPTKTPTRRSSPFPTKERKVSVEITDPPKSVPEAKSEVNLGEIKAKIEKEAVEEALGYLETLKNQTEELHRRELQEFENKASEKHSEILNQETNAAQIGVSQRIEQERVRLNELASAQLEKSRKQLALEAGLRIAQIEQQMISAQQDSEKARFETAASKNEALRQEERADGIKRDAEAALEKHRQITFSNMQQASREMDDLIETVRRLEREKQLIITEATHALESAEKEKEWIQREAQIERLRLIKEAEIAVRHQASLAGSYQSESGSQVPQTHFMSRNSRPHDDSPARSAKSQPSDEELEDGSKLTFPKVKPPRIPTTPRNSPRGRGTDPKVITATGTRTEKPKTVTGTGSSRPSNSRDPPDDEDKDKRDKRERDKKDER
jgi:hypothetical protein